MAEESTNFTVTAGIPFNQRVRITNGVALWEDLSQFEARMQIREEKTVESPLLYNFTPHLECSFDGDDIVVSWALTGAETRLLKSGYYDLIVSDVGSTDARALPPILAGKIKIKNLVTSPEDSP